MKSQKTWFAAGFILCCFAFAVLLMSSATFQQSVKISGNASGKDVVPSVSGNGSATLTGTYDPSSGMLKYTTNWKDLSAAPTTAGFYAGSNGTAGIALGDPWALGTDLKPSGSYSGTIKLTPDQAKQLMNGDWYYSLGTPTNAGGEVRGQIAVKP